jgi:DNA mismatch endonuclease (patch repair protein)
MRFRPNSFAESELLLREPWLDKFDQKTRSRVMGKSKSHGTKSTERRFRALLVAAGVKGWKLGHRSKLIGKPDFFFPKRKIAIFVDGCFWHGCSRCRSIPDTNKEFWASKIARNKQRDKTVRRQLSAAGWRCVRIWEHQLRHQGAALARELL